MKMKPILFNTEMVRAILEGRKTVTRRVIKPQPTYSPRDGFSWNGHAYGTDFPPTAKGAGYNLRGVAPYKVGDILYVRETWNEWEGGYVYKAWNEPFHQVGAYGTWRPSIHMPKEAARIFLKVTGVRVERLQDINSKGSFQDHVTNIAREGIKLQAVMENYEKQANDFKALWDSTIKKDQLQYYSWDANPYVWVIEFERCEKPADMERA